MPPNLLRQRVVAGLGEPVLAAQVFDRHARIGLAQEADYLGFGESLLHRSVLSGRPNSKSKRY
jgi:hypothetical protein